MKIRIIRTKILTAAVLFFTAAGLNAGAIAPFLNVSGSARIDALGGAYTAVGGQADAVGVNPAGIHGLQALGTYFTFFELPGDSNYMRGFIGDSFKFGTVGINFAVYSSGTVEESTANAVGDVTKTGNVFGVSGNQFSATYANSFFYDVATGISVKVITEDYGGVAQTTAFAADLGAQRFFFKRKFMAGLSIMNLGPSVSREDSSGASDPMPLQTRLGVGYKALDIKNHAVLALADGSYFIDEGIKFGIGMEYEAYRMFALRLGYYPNSSTENFAVGAGFHKLLNQTDYAIDYSMKNHPDSGLNNQITIRASWQPVTAKKIHNPYVRIELNDGSVLVGKVLNKNAKMIELDVLSQGRTKIDRSKIKDLQRLSN